MYDSKNEKRNILYRLSVAITWVVVIATIALYIIGQFALKHDVLNVGEGKLLDITWEYETESGATGTCTVPVRLDTDDYEWVKLTSVLPDDIEDGMYICVMAGRGLKLYIDGELRFNHTGYDSEIPGRVVKSELFPIKLSAADAGKSVVILKDEDNAYNGNILSIYYGEMYAIDRLIVDDNIIKFGMGILLFVMAVLTIIASIIAGVIYKVNNVALMVLGFGMVGISTWVVTDSFLYQFAFNNIYVDGLMGYILTPIMPIPFIRYINEVQRGRYEKVQSAIMAGLVLDELVMSGLHFLDIRSFEKTLLINDLIVGIAILLQIIFLVLDYRRGYAREYRWVAIGVMAMVVCSILEIIFINLHIVAFNGVWMMLGVYLLIGACMVHTLGDIMDSERERRKAIESNRIKTAFLANMSHEIRTPINSVMGMNEMILRESNDADITEYAEHIKRSCNLLLSIIGDVLDISKIEAGKMNIVSDPYNIANIIGDVTNLLNQQAANRNLETKIDISSDIPAVLDGDENHIRQILINLVTNAIKYTQNGTVSLKAYSEDVKDEDEKSNGKCILFFEVSDTGIGIKKSDIDRLFDSFERADESKNKHIQGTGLGLAIVKNLTEAMGGTISVESVYGKGSTFKVRIPQRIISRTPVSDNWKTAGTEDSEKERKYVASFKAPKASILAVDDNSSNLMIIKQLLKQTRVNIQLADNGKEAIELSSNNKYDVILLDHMMPEPDGIQVLKAIRGSAANPNKKTPIIVLTANATKDSRDEYRAIGFDDYIAKPVNGSTLESILADHIPEELIERQKADSVPAPEAIADEDKGESSAPVKGAETVQKRTNTGGSLKDHEAFNKSLRIYGTESFTYEIMDKVAADTLDMLDILKKDIEAEDFADYAIRAHGIKGMMASVYNDKLRERSKAHEMAAKSGDVGYIKKDYEDYNRACRDFCEMVINRE